MDLDQMRAVVAAIPKGSWMSYGDVARAAGGTDQHARALEPAVHPRADPGLAPRAQVGRDGRRHRARRPGGGPASSKEGLEFEGGRADPEARVRPEVAEAA